MKKIFVMLQLMILAVAASSQVSINPQVGTNYTSLRNLSNGESTLGRAGWQAGFDIRTGERLYFQPGLFIAQTRTIYVLTDNNVVSRSEFVRTTGHLKGLLAFNLIDTRVFRIRANAGPSFDFLIDNSVNSSQLDDVSRNALEDNFKKGVFNLYGGIGLDIWRLTGELGYSVGLTNALDNHDFRYGTAFMSIGVLLGNN